MEAWIPTLIVLEHFIPTYFNQAFEKADDYFTFNVNPHASLDHTNENVKRFCSKFQSECDLYYFLVQRLRDQFKVALQAKAKKKH